MPGQLGVARLVGRLRGAYEPCFARLARFDDERDGGRPQGKDDDAGCHRASKAEAAEGGGAPGAGMGQRRAHAAVPELLGLAIGRLRLWRLRQARGSRAGEHGLFLLVWLGCFRLVDGSRG